jgi:acyl-CoA reductase-like NAD-dependent aldehyde dehydrogenase
MTKDRAELEFFNVVGGKPRTASEYHRVIDPRTEGELWDAPIASEQDLDDAVAAGQEAFKTFRRTTNKERREFLLAVRQNMLDNVELLATTLTKETGKSMLMAQIEVERAAFHFEYYGTGTNLGPAK